MMLTVAKHYSFPFENRDIVPGPDINPDSTYL